MRTNLLKFCTLLCLLFVGIGNVWGDEVTFTAGTDKADGTTITKSGITLSATKFSGDTYYQAYSGTPLKVTSTVGNITKVEVTCTTSGTSNYGPSKFSTKDGTYKYSGSVGTWTGDATSVSLATSAQVRMTKVVVTYSGNGGSAQSYKLYYTKNDNGSAVASVDGVAVSNEGSVEAGKTVTLTANPNDEYEFSYWNVYKGSNQYNTVAISDNSFVMPESDVTVQVFFTSVSSIPNATVSLPEGSYRGTQTVKITNIDEDSYTYYYTLDGTDPAINEAMELVGTTQEYDDANGISISSSCTLKVLTTDLDNNKINSFQYTIEQPYTVTIETPVNGTLSVKNNNADVTNGATLYKGDIISITATPNDGYKFRNIQVVDATTHTFTSSNTKEWTMGEAAITIKANFDEIQYYTINYSVNGTIESTQEKVAEGTPLMFPEVDGISGKVFTGWVKSSTVDAESAPTYVPTAGLTATEDVTYYAVFAIKSGGSEVTTHELDSKTISGAYKTSGTEATNSYASRTLEGWSGIFQITKTDDYVGIGLTNKHETNTDGSRKANYNNHLESPLFDAQIVSVNIKGYISGTTSRKIYLCAADVDGKPSAQDASLGIYENPKSDTKRTFDATMTLTNNARQLFIYVDEGGMLLTSISVTCGVPATYSDFCTTVPEAAGINVSAAGYTTYYNSEKAYVMPEGVEGYVAYWDYDETNSLKVEKAYEAGNVVPEDVALVLKANLGTYYLEYTDAEGDDPEENDLCGTDEATDLATGEPMMDAAYYFYGLTLNADGDLNSVGFYWMEAGGAPFENGAHKAYLPLPRGLFESEEEVKGFSFADLTTAIKNVENVENSAKIFDMQGRQLNAVPTRGLYILNGKKYMVK